MSDAADNAHEQVGLLDSSSSSRVRDVWVGGELSTVPGAWASRMRVCVLLLAAATVLISGYLLLREPDETHVQPRQRLATQTHPFPINDDIDTPIPVAVQGEAGATGSAAPETAVPATPASKDCVAWSVPENGKHPDADLLRNRQRSGPREATDRLKFTVHAQLNLKCDEVWQHTMIYADQPNDPHGREICKGKIGSPENCADIGDKVFRLPMSHASVPFYLSITQPVGSTWQGIIINHEASWLLPAQCAHHLPHYFGPQNAGGKNDAQIKAEAHWVGPRAINLGQLWSQSYFHFMLEVMPKLMQLPRDLVYDRNFTLILPPLQYKGQYEILDWFGLRDKVHTIDTGKWIWVEEELIAPMPGICAEAHPLLASRYQRVLWQNLARFSPEWRKLNGDCYDARRLAVRPWPQTKDQRAAYNLAPVSAGGGPTEAAPDAVPSGPLAAASRSSPTNSSCGSFFSIIWMERKGGRALGNNAELRAAAQATFPCASFTDFTGEGTMLETAMQWSQADLIIGPHGAGLTNLLFTPPGFVTVEFMPKEYTNMVYHHYSEVFGGIHINTVTHGGNQAMDGLKKVLADLKAITPEQRREQIKEGVERRIRYDTTCVTKLQEEGQK